MSSCKTYMSWSVPASKDIHQVGSVQSTQLARKQMTGSANGPRTWTDILKRRHKWQWVHERYSAPSVIQFNPPWETPDAHESDNYKEEKDPRHWEGRRESGRLCIVGGKVNWHSRREEQRDLRNQVWSPHACPVNTQRKHFLSQRELFLCCK